MSQSPGKIVPTFIRQPPQHDISIDLVTLIRPTRWGASRYTWVDDTQARLWSVYLQIQALLDGVGADHRQIEPARTPVTLTWPPSAMRDPVLSRRVRKICSCSSARLERAPRPLSLLWVLERVLEADLLGCPWIR